MSPNNAAISYCLRVFHDAFVERMPEPQHALEILVEPCRWLSELGQKRPRSYRLALFHETGETRDEVLLRCGERARSLDFGLRYRSWPFEVSSGVTRKDGSAWNVWGRDGRQRVRRDRGERQGALAPEPASRREGRVPSLGELFSSHMNRSTSIARGALAGPAGASCPCMT